MSKRVQGLLAGVLTGAFLAGGVAYAVTVVPPNDTDRYWACVSTTGAVRSGTMQLNVQPTSCPKASDTVRSWSAKGPQGVQGPAGPAGPAGPPGTAGLAVLTVHVVGVGSVTGPGISCGLDCSEPFVLGETPGVQAVAATGTGDAGSVFRGWSGDCIGSGTCSLNMDGPRNLTATFEPLAVSGFLTYDKNLGGWTIVFTNDATTARTGLTVHVDALFIGSSRGPFYIPSITTSRGTLNLVPYLPGWTATHNFAVTDIDLDPGESVNVHVGQYAPCTGCAFGLESKIGAPVGGESTALDIYPHTGECAWLPITQGCRDFP